MTSPTALEAPLGNLAQEYHDAQRGAIPAIYKTTHERMAVELTLGIDEPDTIFARYGYTPEQALALVDQPGFAIMLDRISKEIRESGLSFKIKVRAQAEELLTEAFQIAQDPLAPTAERVKLIIWHGLMAGHAPSVKDDKGAANSSGLNLTIQFSGQAPQAVVSSHQPALIEQEI